MIIRLDKPDTDNYRPSAGVMLFDARGLVWVGQRINTPGAWQMPQGGIDPGETPAEAALRELEEETGTGKAELLAESEGWLVYDLPPELMGRAWGGRYRGQVQKWFACRFLGEDADIDIHGVDHPEFNEWQWVDIDRVPRLIVDFKRAVYEEITAEFRHFSGRGDT